MGIGVVILVIVVLIAIIWIFAELRRFNHKFLAIFLIILILSSYFGFVITLKEKDIDYKSLDGLQTVVKLYFVWIGSIFKNFKSITAHTIKLDWKGDASELNTKNVSKS